MKEIFPPKTLHLIIKTNWLVESITGLGSGYIFHLSYQNNEIEPEVLQDIQDKTFGEGHLGQIIFDSPESKRRVAVVEIFKINQYVNSVRFDLRLLEVVPFVRNGFIKESNSYLAYYPQHPA